MIANNKKETRNLSKHRILISSVTITLLFSMVVLTVWFTVKSRFERSIAEKVQFTAQVISEQVLDAQSETEDLYAFKLFLGEQLKLYGDYYIEVIDSDGGTLFEQGVQAASLDIYEVQLPLRAPKGSAHDVVLTVRTTPQFLSKNSYRFIYVGLVVAITMALLLGVTVYSVQSVFRTSKKLAQSNIELEKARLYAERTSNLKTEFLANMSHEIRTPMNVILGFIAVLKADKISKQHREYLNLMEVSSKNLLSIVNDILDIEKLESGEIQLRKVSFNPLAELEQIVKLQDAFFDEKGLYLHSELLGAKNIWVEGDPNKFHQIFTNLIRNAFKFTEKGGVNIRANVYQQDQNVRYVVEVEDSGIGIPQEKMEEIFDRYIQVDSSPNRKHEGTGLGLAITKKLVEAMGGTIAVKSSFGEGATFILDFTFKKVDHLIDTLNDEPLYDDLFVPLSFTGKKVLVIDDHYVNILVIQKTLQQLDIKTEFTESPEEGIELATNTAYDLIFMDVHMPVIDGYLATRAIRKRGVTTPIVALSADVTSDAKKNAFEHGMQDFLSKPFSRPKLVIILKKFLLQEV